MLGVFLQHGVMLACASLRFEVINADRRAVDKLHRAGEEASSSSLDDGGAYACRRTDESPDAA